MDIQILKDRIKEIEAARESYQTQANQQMGAFSGAIAEVQRLIDLLQKEPDKTDTVPVERS